MAKAFYVQIFFWCTNVPFMLELTNFFYTDICWPGLWKCWPGLWKGFFGSESVGFFPNVLYRSIKEVLDGFLMMFLIHPFIDTPYLDLKESL